MVSIEQGKQYIKENGKTLATVLVIVFLSGAYLHQAQANTVLKQTASKPSSSNANAEAAALRSEVAKLIELPSDETPTIATVTDVSKLQNQSFFAKAQNGDKVLMFAKAKEVILYRPSTHKIVQVAPLNPGTTPNQ